MRWFQRKERPLSVPVKVRRPLFERMQEWVIRMDVGRTVRWFRLGLFVLIVAVVVLYYTGTQFFGLRDPEVMNLAQLGRNLARGRGYVTQVVRPLDLWYLGSINRLQLPPNRPAVPELWTPPMYPAVVGAALRLLPHRLDLRALRDRLKLGAQLPMEWRLLEVVYDAGRSQTLALDRVLVMVGWVFFLAGLVLLYVMARELFDHQAAVVCVFLYLFCDPLLRATVNGGPTGLLMLLFMVAAYGVFKAEKWHEARKPPRWVNGALAVSALAVGVGTLTQYAFAAVLVPLLVYVAVSFRRRHWKRRVGMCLLIVVLVLAPWMARNWRVSRTWFGLWKVAVYEGVQPNRYTTIKVGDLQRKYGLDVDMRWRPLARKLLVNLRSLYETGVKDVGSSYLIAFFLASLLHRFRREEIFRLRRFVFWSLLACVLWLSLAGPPKQNFLTIFLPLIILYGVAFFYVIFERLQFRTRLLRRGMIGLFVLMNLLPFVFTVLPPWESPPYPPYDGGLAGMVGSAFREEELLASDIPCAVAWYGDRAAVWLPLDQQDYMTINDDVHVITGLYLTQQFVLDQVPMEIASVRYPFWRQMYLQPPAGFPLQVSRPLTPDGQQVLVSDRPR